MTLQRKFAFASFAVLLLLGAIEIAGRLLVPVNGNARWNYESNHVRLTGFPALNDILEPDEKRFWKLKANVPTRQIIGRVGTDNLIFNFSTDGDGFRRLSNPLLPQHTVLFIGDSCTLGIGVNDEAAIPAVVQTELPEIRCVNAGVPGYTAYQGRVYLESIIDGLKPDAVVMCFGFNDDVAWDNRSDLEHAGDIAAPLKWHNQLGIARLISRFAMPPPTAKTTAARPRLTDAEFTKEVESMLSTCAAHGAKPILLVWPLREQMTNRDYTAKQTALIQIGRTSGVALVSLLDIFRTRELKGPNELRQSDWAFADLLHFNEQGCQVAGQLIAGQLRPIVSP